ncbi:hypothetical protein F5Y18DRAFT_79737 [Xylariaceae sp. FL1019]|nr:hypothetical protein F5Y18DRAFT_79737 [Xylariaceae sp. FL1019]
MSLASWGIVSEVVLLSCCAVCVISIPGWHLSVGDPPALQLLGCRCMCNIATLALLRTLNCTCLACGAQPEQPPWPKMARLANRGTDIVSYGLLFSRLLPGEAKSPKDSTTQ